MKTFAMSRQNTGAGAVRPPKPERGLINTTF
jgi:hypothetical protein